MTIGIRAKLLAGFVTVALFTGALGWYAVGSMERMNAGQRTLVVDVFGGTYLMATWIDQSTEARLDLLAYVLTDDAQERARLRADMTALDTSLDELGLRMDAADIDRQDVRGLAGVLDAWQAYRTWRDRAVIAPVEAGDRAAAVSAYQTEGSQVQAELDHALDIFLEQKGAVSRDLESSAGSTYELTREWAVGLALVATALALLIGFFVSRSIAAAAGQVARSARALAVGDLQQEISAQSTDELGQMADAFREMVGYQREMAAFAEAIARGDLTGDVRPKSERDVLGSAIQRMGANLRTLIGELKVALEQNQALNVTLEQRVAERTHELEAAVVKLREQMAERERAEAGLRESEERYRQMFQKNQAIKLLIDPATGVILDANEAASRFYGWPRADLQGQLITEINVLPAPVTAAEMTRAAAEERNYFLFRHRLASGDVRDVEVYSSPVDVGGQRLLYSIIHDVTDRKRAEEALRHQALHDPLTDLPNRTLLSQLIAHAIDEARCENTQVSLLLLDVDRFKEINDTLGHAIGDTLLQQFASRVESVLAGAGMLARLGGDEFAILLPGADADAASNTASVLRRALDRSFEVEGSTVAISASIGIAVCPAAGDDPADDATQTAVTLLRRADVAMYAAKSSQAGYAVYAPDHDHHSPERLALEADLRRALEHDELVLKYQPQVDVRSGALASVEALVRWRHPTRGLVPPEEFIRLAEQTRLIRPITRWVMDAALRQCRAWREAGFDIPVAINLSIHDLQDPALPDQVNLLLTTHAVTPEQLRLEITESALLVEPRRAREVLARLRATGVRISIDDFGTGYSSLAYLKDLPVDELKIDRSFVRDMAADPSARAIVRAVIDMADDLGLRVIAEGVEDRATLQVLASLGCDLAQGYHFSPPVGAAELAGWAAGVVPAHLAQPEWDSVETALGERVRRRSARLAAEEDFLARKRAEAALRASEERYRSVVDSVRDIIFQSDADGRWTFLNPAWAELTGFSVEESLGKPEGDFVHPDDREQHREVFRRVTNGDQNTCRYEVRYMTRDGSFRWFEAFARLALDSHGSVAGASGTLYDVTERKDAEQRRRALNQAEKLRSMGQMASGVAHDLNQSLGLIAGYGGLAHRAIEQSPPDLKALREALPIVTRAAMDGGATVRRLLTFTRGQPAEEPERVDVGAVLREVAELTAPRWRDASQADGRPITLDVETGRAELVVCGWPAGLREAVINLVFNAIDALPSGGTIRLAARQEAAHIVVEVTDSGIGIPPDVKTRIFEPFFSTKGERGTGLGLAQVFGIVEQHRGEVAVDSTPGQGTTVRLTLQAAPPLRAAAQRVPTTAATPDARKLRVLAVDDEPAIGSMVKRILRPDGHTVATATSGEQALEQLAADHFDVVISDVGMGPGMNGWELAAEVRRRWPHVRLVLATGWGAAIDPAEARSKGIDAVLAKPYQPADLQKLLSDRVTQELVQPSVA